MAQSFSTEFCVKGVVLDTVNGNLMKLNQDKQIKQAIHGNTQLNLTQLVETYGPTRQLTDFNGTRTDKYWTIATYFEIAAGCVYNRMVNLNDKEDFYKQRTPREMIKDLSEGISETFYDEFKGDYFPTFRQNIGHYIYDNSKTLVELFEFFKKQDKKLFLLSNSLPHYTFELLDSLIGKHWKDYFEVIMCRSLKPKFFHPTNSKSYLNYFDPKKQDTKLYKGATTKYGNVTELMDFLQIQNGEQVVYFGDHPVHDIREAKKLCNWTTVQVEEELDPVENEKGDSYANFKQGREKLWGKPLLCDNELSYWGSQIKKYSDYQIPSLAHFVKILKENENKFIFFLYIIKI
eukprot:Anaeramoba_flamelloidesa1067665_43.p1 GENE.a1067665_43~~a1067665_43.p1  ORF type:complete len:394 (+),score=80.71 a1067665_43:142-1182(+)